MSDDTMPRLLVRQRYGNGDQEWRAIGMNGTTSGALENSLIVGYAEMPKNHRLSMGIVRVDVFIEEIEQGAEYIHWKPVLFEEYPEAENLVEGFGQKTGGE